MVRRKTSDIFRSMKIYMDEDSMYKGEKLSDALVTKLRQLGVPEVTVTHGMAGYGKWNRHITDPKESVSSVPVIVEAIDHSWQISNVMWKIDEMVNKCFVTTTDIVVVNYNEQEEQH